MTDIPPKHPQQSTRSSPPQAPTSINLRKIILVAFPLFVLAPALWRVLSEQLGFFASLEDKMATKPSMQNMNGTRFFSSLETN